MNKAKDFMQIQKTILFIGSPQQWLSESIKMFEKNKQIVLVALTGDEGYLMAQCDTPDLIICEFNLIDMSGIEFCQLIRQDEELCRVPIILVNDKQQNIEQIIDDFESGIRDELTVCCNLELKKTTLASGNKNLNQSLEDSYQLLCARHELLTEMIKDTSDLIKALDIEHSFSSFIYRPNFNTQINNRIESGMVIIDGLKCLLAEQSNHLNELARTLDQQFTGLQTYFLENIAIFRSK